MIEAPRVLTPVPMALEELPLRIDRDEVLRFQGYKKGVVKSISFPVGVGPEARVDHYFTQCRRCWMRDCAYRRAPAAVTVHR